MGCKPPENRYKTYKTENSGILQRTGKEDRNDFMIKY
jgi:hypothetical protein